MKKFVFKYEKILDLRITRENELKNNISKISKAIGECEDLLLQSENERQKFMRSLEENMKNGVRVSELHLTKGNKDFLKDKIIRIKAQLTQLLKEKKQIQSDLIESNKQKKIMEKLKEKDYSTYLELESQEENRVMDEIVTYTSTRKRGD